MATGQIGYVRLFPLLNEVFGGIMVPVVQLKDFGSGFDHLLNLGILDPSCNQMVWPRDSRCDVWSTPAIIRQDPCYYPNDGRTERRPGRANASVHGTNTPRAMDTLVKAEIRIGSTYLVHIELVYKLLAVFNESLRNTGDTIAPRSVKLMDTVPLWTC